MLPTSLMVLVFSYLITSFFIFLLVLFIFLSLTNSYLYSCSPISIILIFFGLVLVIGGITLLIYHLDDAFMGTLFNPLPPVPDKIYVNLPPETLIDPEVQAALNESLRGRYDCYTDQYNSIAKLAALSGFLFILAGSLWIRAGLLSC